MSFHDVHDLAIVAAQADLCALVEGLEAGVAGLLIGVLALLRGGL